MPIMHSCKFVPFHYFVYRSCAGPANKMRNDVASQKVKSWVIFCNEAVGMPGRALLELHGTWMCS